VSQWSKGEYYLANNTEDDLAIIAGRLSYRADDHGDTPGTATPLVISGGTNIVSTTPETDPDNVHPANKGVLESSADTDVFSFTTGNGAIRLTVNPWIMPAGTRGGNLDVLIELRDATGAVILTNDPASQTLAQIQTSVTEGAYYLHVRSTGTGDPMSSTPTGYTSYASIGQYFISGYLAPSNSVTPIVQLTATVNNPAWGTVDPTNGAYAPGTSVQVHAAPTVYCSFVGWTGDVSGTNEILSLVLNTNVSIQAIFGEVLTTNCPTPLWWLVSNGYTNDFEAVVTHNGANGIPLWQSYIAGLDPNDPNSQLRMSLNPGTDGTSCVLEWNTAADRVYSIWWSTNPDAGFIPLSGATNLPATIQGITTTVDPNVRSVFYRVQVQKP